MIEAIKNIGEFILEKKGININNPIEILIQNPAPKEIYKHILAIELEKSFDIFSFKRVILEDYTKDKEKKVLYRSGPSKGTDFTPTTRITEKYEIGKKFNDRILKWFKGNEKNTIKYLDKEDITFFNNLYSCLKKNKSKIIAQLEEIAKEISSENTGIITLVFIEDGERKYLNKFTLFEKIMIENYYIGLKWSKTHKVDSSSNNNVCSVCNIKSKVYGFVSTFQFYNLDKPGFISDNFNYSNSWKNYPVCLDCALKLEVGKKYLEDNLSFSLYGNLYYYFIPKLILKGDISKIMEYLEQDFGKNKRKFGLNKIFINTVEENEEDTSKLLIEKKNFLNYILMFYDTERHKSTVFRILLLIEDILPSHLKKLFEIKEKVDSKHIFQNVKGKKPLRFTLENVWRFYPKISYGENKIDLSKYFLEITNKIFTNKKINFEFLLRGIMRKIRIEFRKGNSIKYTTLMAFQLLDYLNELKILNRLNGGKYMNENKIFDNGKTNSNDKADAIFNNFSGFFNSDAKKAIFLEGALTQFLLDIQYQERNSTPFKTKLHGLNLDEKLVKALLPKIQNKLEEYGKNYYKNQESKISEYMVKSGNNWKMTKDEISFYFIIGMCLSDQIKATK